MERDLVIILSDIHIGTKASYAWYQKEIHEKYLIAIFNDIIENAKQIQEVVLLGDIFEFWIYPPNEIPPTMDDIIVQHPKILGINGSVRKALSALEGRMVFVAGNHDMIVTQFDLNKLKSLDGYTIKSRPSVYIPIYAPNLKFVHGHEHTLLNAPYYKSKLAPIPIGYFINRAYAYQMQNDRKKATKLTIEDLEEDRTYSLTSFLTRLPDFLKNYEDDFDFINKLIDAVAVYIDIPKDILFKINKNTSVTLNEVKKIYKNLNSDFFERRLLHQTENTQHVVQGRMEEIPWYLKTPESGSSQNVVVMGHSHIPQNVLEKDNIQYIDTGLICPVPPYLTTYPIKYGIYSISNKSMQLRNDLDRHNLDKSISNSYNSANTQNKEEVVLSNSNSVRKSDIIKKEVNKQIVPSKFTFGWSVFDASLEYWQEIQLGVLSKAEELGINIISHDEKSNSVEMVVGSIDLINKGVDALIIAPFNPELLPVIVEEAKLHKIPVISIDTGTGGADVAVFIVSDSFGGGVFAGEYALQLIKKYKVKNKNIAIIKVQKTASYALLRGEGFKSVMVEYGYKVIAEVPGNSEELLAYEVMKSILNIYKDDLAVVFCENGTMTLGAARAIKEVGKKGIIKLLGFDSGPSIIEGIKNGSIQGTIGQQPFKMGQIGVEAANAILQGMPVIFDDWTQNLILMEVFLINESGEIQRGVV